jgi:hypothetical protein
MRPSSAQVERAEGCAAAAGLVYDKLDTHLTPLISRAGVQALFARSVRQAQTERPCLAEVAAGVEVAANLRACLQSLEPRERF